MSIGCRNKEKQGLQVAPKNFISISDSSLSSHQDTIYHRNERFSGILFSLSEKQDTLIHSPVLNGLKEGVSKRWYDNGQLAEERLYVKGKKEGIHKGWWPNGNPKFEFAISNDEYQNEFKEWNPEGKLIKFFHYKNGHEEGDQHLWYDDGKVRANYVIANGRRYGLLGTKNCTNVSDSVFRD